MNNNKWKQGAGWLNYVIFSRHKKGHGIHSPFLFDLITGTFNSKKKPDDSSQIRELRNEWKKSHEVFHYTDPGNGDAGKKEHKLSYLARTASTPEKYGKLLYRLVRKFQPLTVLEIGTCLGLGTLYLSEGSDQARVITMEGIPALAAKAREGFSRLGRKNIELVEGGFETTLPGVLDGLKKVDMVFFDGNHTYEATNEYFKRCLGKAHNDSVFIFDDIHWSEGMEKAWREIQQSDAVTLTVDLFRMGLVFFRRELSKQDFTVRF